MKKALSTALVAALSLILFLAIVNAQEEGGGVAVPGLLEQELAEMERVFSDLESFMGDVVSEVKGNMADVEDLFGEARDLRDLLHAISVEVKEAEGKLVGLRDDVDRMAGDQQEFKVRIVAVEAGLSELSAYCDELSAKVDINAADIIALQENCSALAADYSEFKDMVLADISAIKKAQQDIDLRVKQIEDEDVGTFKKKVLELERSMSALAIKVDNNRAKLEGFDHAIAGLATDIEANANSIVANMSLIEDHEVRLVTLEDGSIVAELQEQISTLYFIGIIALLAGVGALVYGFIGN